MGTKFKDLFLDDNNLNEKTIIGFISFGLMTMFALADLVTGLIGWNFTINEVIYNSFLILTLGALGIGSVDKYVNKDKPRRGGHYDDRYYVGNPHRRFGDDEGDEPIGGRGDDY